MTAAFLFQCFIIFLGVGLFGALLQVLAPDNQIFHQDSINSASEMENDTESDDRVERFLPSENVERFILDETTDSQNQVNHEHHHHYHER